MADVRNVLRSMSPQYALRNARREVIEHARVVAEVDALIARVSARGAVPGPTWERSRLVASPAGPNSDVGRQTLESSARAS